MPWKKCVSFIVLERPFANFCSQKENLIPFLFIQETWDNHPAAPNLFWSASYTLESGVCYHTLKLAIFFLPFFVLTSKPYAQELQILCTVL